MACRSLTFVNASPPRICWFLFVGMSAQIINCLKYCNCLLRHWSAKCLIWRVRFLVYSTSQFHYDLPGLRAFERVPTESVLILESCAKRKKERKKLDQCAVKSECFFGCLAYNGSKRTHTKSRNGCHGCNVERVKVIQYVIQQALLINLDFGRHLYANAAWRVSLFQRHKARNSM